MINNVPDPSLRIPIGIHGDDAGAHGQEQTFTLTWGSVAASLPTLDSRIVFTMMKVSAMGAGTLQELLKVLVWSIASLSEGTFPHADHDGREFSPTYYPKRASVAGQRLANGLSGLTDWGLGDWGLVI